MHVLNPASHAVSDVAATSGAVLAVNNGSYNENRHVTTILAGTGCVVAYLVCSALSATVRVCVCVLAAVVR